ncbi:anti-sigma regulatory factor [Oscillatoriales cyanobacterium LEGE 11467]|uniref:Anti-sigma regulatory factor n=1 Tax=Zarconia navalis LEGE 11467 TaxID=1828826 RepID=A0A928Z9L9_9CYAN|nr:anti-sigma regulatory factor [Zarconia navalis]MBE9041844.1 anti-sigma regulatory factor [Zarconia navalis LEGE 11467]
MKTELHIPSELRFLNIVENWLLGCLEMDLGESEDWLRQSNRLRLVLAEAYSNVVRHAHKDRPHLPVTLRLELHQSNLVLEVWDFGRGYHLEDYEAPTPEALQEGGYGWLIMNRLMDRVEYIAQPDGRNCLKLEADLLC